MSDYDDILMKNNGHSARRQNFAKALWSGRKKLTHETKQ